MNKDFIFHIFWGLVVIILPVLIRTNDIAVDIRFPRHHTLVWLTVFSLLVFGFSKPIEKLNRNFLVFLILMIPLASLNRFVFNSYEYNEQLICFFSGLALLTQMITNLKKEYFYILERCVAITGLIQAIIVIPSYFNFEPYKWLLFSFNPETIVHKGNNSIVPEVVGQGSLGNPNFSGALIAICLPFMFNYPIAFIIGIIGMALTSTMPVVSFALSSVVMLWLKPLKMRFTKILILLGFPSISYAFYMANTKGSYFYAGGREVFWANAVKLMDMVNTAPSFITKAKHYLFGRGLGYISDYYWRVFGGEGIPKVKQLHNEYMEFFVAFGALGSILLIWFLWTQRKEIFKGPTVFLWSFLVICLNSVANFPFHLASTSLIGIICMGVLFRGGEYGLQVDSKSSY